MSLEVNPLNKTIHNQSSRPGFLTKLVAPLALGAAVAFGGQAIADQPPPDNAQPVQNEPAPEQPANPSSRTYICKYGIGYLLGIGVEKLIQAGKKRQLQAEIDDLTERLSRQQTPTISIKPIEKPSAGNPST